MEKMVVDENSMGLHLREVHGYDFTTRTTHFGTCEICQQARRLGLDVQSPSNMMHIDPGPDESMSEYVEHDWGINSEEKEAFVYCSTCGLRQDHDVIEDGCPGEVAA